MYTKWTALTIELLLVLIGLAQAHNGERIDAFPHGPVKEITTSVVLEDGKVLVAILE